MNNTEKIQLDSHPKQIIELPNFRDFVHSSMEKLIQGSQIEIGGHTVNTPAGVPVYPGCWIRDYTMLCESGYAQITPEFIREGLDLFLENIGSHGEIPDWVPSNKNKHVVYDLFGRYPFLDNPFWLLRLMVLYIDASQDISFFLTHEKKIFAGMEARNLLDRKDELLKIYEDNLTDDWGFTDCVKKTGYVLMSNLHKLDSYRTLSRLYHYAGNEHQSHEFEKRFSNLQLNLVKELYCPQHSLFMAATGVNRKIDVWGNAFGVYLGVFPHDIESTVIRALYHNKAKFEWKGQIRHLFQPQTWDAFLAPTGYLKILKNTYQNGAYWGVPSGWMAYVFERAEPGAGKILIEELLTYYQKYGIYECVYPKFLRHYRKCKHYVASLALPMRLLKLN